MLVLVAAIPPFLWVGECGRSARIRTGLRLPTRASFTHSRYVVLTGLPSLLCRDPAF